MNRRDALSRISLIFGGTVIGAQAFLTGCQPGNQELMSQEFNPEKVSFLDEVGETILPATDTPGAKEAKIGEFMQTIVTDCYTEPDQKIFMEGIGKLNDAANEKFDADFMNLEPTQRHDLLVALDKEAKDYEAGKKEGDPSHYFTMMKQLTLWGYFTSEPGATKALRYVETPGRYEGCMPYKKGDKAWAL